VSQQEPLCEDCGKRRATVHLTEFVGGQPVQHHLCEECFRKREGNLGTPSSVFAQLLASVAPELRRMSGRHCPACGISYLEFRQSMKFGCAHDYEAFEDVLDPLLERIHGATRHCGKGPVEGGSGGEQQGRLRALRQRLQQAVEQENYELAARLRDRIRELEGHGPEDPEG